jgi:hypothetical protein
LRPEKFVEAAFAAVVAAHPCVDAFSLTSANGFDIATVVASSQMTRTAVVIQREYADSIGDIFAYSEKHMGYGPLMLHSFSRPSSSDIAEFTRAQRVGRWVIIHVMENSIYKDIQWLADLMPWNPDNSRFINSESTSLEDSSRSIPHTQFRLWIISSVSEAVPPKILEVAHVAIHERSAHCFAAAAAASVESSSLIRDELCPKCTPKQRRIVSVFALLHAFFYYKTSCSAFLSPYKYDSHPSLPALRVQISFFLSLSRSITGSHANAQREAGTQRLGTDPDDLTLLLQSLCGGCSLLMGCCDMEQKRLLFLAENIFCSACSAGFTSANIAKLMALPVPLILAAEACDRSSVANCMTLHDSDCDLLGADVQRVHSLQQSCGVIADIQVMSATSLRSSSLPERRRHSLLLEHTERYFSWIEQGALCRPNVAEDFLLHSTELTETQHLSVNANRPPVTASLLTLYEVLLRLPEDIGIANA